MSTLDWSLQQATKTTAQIAAATTTIPLRGQIVWNTDTGKYCIGDGTTALSALTFYGGISASGLTVGTTTITGGTSTRVLYNNAGVVGEYAVTGTGTTAVLSTSPTFVTDITTPLIKGVAGVLQTFSTDLVNIGNKVTTNQRTLRIGQGSGWVDIGEWNTVAGYGALYLSVSNPGGGNFALAGNATDTYLNASSSSGSVFLQVGNNTISTFKSTGIILTAIAQNSGAFTNFTFTAAASTNQTTTTNIPNFKITGASKQWATGTVANQYWNYLSANTAAFVGASTMTNSYGLYVEAATAGTNATITNNYAAGFGGMLRVIDGTIGGAGIVLREVVSIPTYAGLYMSVTPSSTNYTLANDGAGNVFVNSTTSVYISLGATNVSRFLPQCQIHTPSDGGTSSLPTWRLAPSNQSGGTGLTEIPVFLIDSHTRTWGNGNIATQRWVYLKAQTAAFGSPYTITNGYGLYAETPLAGANCTITNAYSFGTNGKAKFGGNIELTQTVTTEALTSDTSVTIVINGVTYKLLAKA